MNRNNIFLAALATIALLLYCTVGIDVSYADYDDQSATYIAATSTVQKVNDSNTVSADSSEQLGIIKDTNIENLGKEISQKQREVQNGFLQAIESISDAILLQESQVTHDELNESQQVRNDQQAIDKEQMQASQQIVIAPITEDEIIAREPTKQSIEQVITPISDKSLPSLSDDFFLNWFWVLGIAASILAFIGLFALTNPSVRFFKKLSRLLQHR